MPLRVAVRRSESCSAARRDYKAVRCNEMSTPKNQELIEALNHPLRRKLLKLVIGQGRVTVREGAQALGEPMENVRYHIRALSHLGALEHMGTRSVRYARASCWAATSIVEESSWILEVLELPSLPAESLRQECAE